MTVAYGWTSTASLSNPPDPSIRACINGTSLKEISINCPFLRVNVSSTTTVFLGTMTTFSGGTTTACEYAGWNGLPTWAHQSDRENSLEAELTTALSAHINMRLAAKCMWDNYTADNAYPSAAPAETWDPATGVEIAVTQLNPAALAEVANYNHCMARDITVQNDYAGNFKLGSGVDPAAGRLGLRAVRNHGMGDPRFQSPGRGYRRPVRRVELHPVQPTAPAVFGLHDAGGKSSRERLVRAGLRAGAHELLRRPSVPDGILLAVLGGGL